MKICMGCMEQYGDVYEVCPHCGYIEGTPTAESYHMEPGTILAKHYIVGKVIGSGGFGTTYLGWDYELGRKIAIKEYLPIEFSTRVQGISDVTIFPGEKEEQFRAGIEKFIEEAQRLVKFKTVPGIVRFYDCFEENKTAYITMEYLEGETLKERLSRNQTVNSNSEIETYDKLTYEEARKILDALLDALEEVHKEGIIHRDIAPDNVFLTKDGGVKLIDFGASRYATTRHSRSLTVLIKEGYSPQEQYRSRGDQGSWTDVYSVAATFYTMVTGMVPQDAMEREAKDEVQRPSKVGAQGIPKHVENAVMNALNRKIEDRTQSCGDFKRELSDEKTTWNFIKQSKNYWGRWPLWLKITSGIASTAVVTFIALLLTGVISFSGIFSVFAPKVGVPGVVGLQKKEAEEALEAAGFKVQYANYIEIEDENVEKDCIYNQTPGANVEKKKGTIVYLAITCGATPKKMVNTVGYDVETATQMLGELELEVQIVSVSGDAVMGAAPNTVVRQLNSGVEIEEGSEDVKEGMVITLEVSEGYGSNLDPNQMSDVPDFTGKSFVEARKEAGGQKLYIEKVTEKYSDQPKDTVIEQKLTAGEQVAQGNVIEITVSKGDKITVPLFELKTKEEAEKLAKDHEIQVTFEEQEHENVPAGSIISQSVENGKEIKYSDKLVLVVSKGSPNVQPVEQEEIEDVREELSKPTSTPKPDSSSSNTGTSNNSSAGQNSGNTGNIGQTTNNQQNNKPASASKPTATSKPSPTPTPVKKDEEVKVTVPDVVEDTQTDAERILRNKNLNVAVKYEFSNSVAEYMVISQSVKANSSVAKGTTVTITVSKGKALPASYTSGWTTDASYINSNWYTCETDIEYLKQTREFTGYEEKVSSTNSMSGYELYNTTYSISWGNEEEYSSQRSVSETYRYVREYDKVTGSHEEWYLSRWWNGTLFKDRAASGYSLDYTSGWYNRSDIWAAATPRWAKDRWHLAWDSEETYPYVHTDTRTVQDTTRYYVYQSGTKVYQYHFRKPIYTQWSSGTWTNSKPTTSDTCQIASTRTVYKYTAK